jgi:hypothetical protein
MARYDDPYTNPDGSFNLEAYEAEQTRIPKRHEIGIGSVWEMNDPVKFPGVWKVTKINPRMISLINERGQELRADIGLLRRTDKIFTEVTNSFRPRPGMVVTTSANVRDLVANTPLVIFKLVSVEFVHVTPIGGATNKYWKLPVASLAQFHGTITL